ncbi:GNAT family N-acetyltransferase [Tissierella sp. MSJ-40]|uniref:GNAT family N-acetyltransferase n=1 Tax=Tissierella simiarum TaxID=2841534 RepID=A0ABS6E6F5_9FIRM|nr:GNAT family N-acetyltransferase [Tissierella simiarum]MBU5438349.1 GNAT family N-acetyltransferase [Tissierella simiarum]
MNKIKIKTDVIPSIESLMNLYNDVGWSVYTDDPSKLKMAYDNSLKVISAWNEDILIGIIRAVGDGCTIIYIQDILLLKKYQGEGIGSILMNEMMTIYKDVRQKVLMTDDQPDTIAFYKKCGFVTPDVYGAIAFVKDTQRLDF